jgi:hypothetical protein
MRHQLSEVGAASAPGRGKCVTGTDSPAVEDVVMRCCMGRRTSSADSKIVHQNEKAYADGRTDEGRNDHHDEWFRHHNTYPALNS